MTDILTGDLLASFDFSNNDYIITEQSKDNILVRMWRELRRQPFIGMKQNTPHGGVLGLQCILEIKRDGLPASFLNFIIYKNKHEIQRGFLNNIGRYENIRIPMVYGVDSNDYLLKVFDINKDSEECNIISEEIYESGRLGYTTTHI